MKTGRKRKDWVNTETGKPVVGLARRPSDNRWRIIETGYTFTEPNEFLAIAKFERLTAKSLPLTIGNRTTDFTYNAVELEEYLQHLTDKNDAPFWRRVTEELTIRPKYAAKKTGIEKLAYINDLKPPEPSAKLAKLKEIWCAHAKCSKEQRAKVSRSWDDFTETTSITTVAEITAPLCVEYQDHVHKRGLAGKQQQHLFSSIKTLLNFCKKRAIAVKEISSALDCLRLMQPDTTTKSIDPKPLNVADWKALYAKATGDDKTMILLMLNACMYAGEVITLEWEDITDDGCLVGRRNKTGEFLRVAKLWPETIKALKAMDRTKGPHIFRAITGQPLKKDGAFARFRKLAKNAEVKKVTPSHLRDGAYTAAVAANVTLPLCQLLAGHATGMSDNYVLGNPSMVAPACEAIRKHYFGE
jgi:site-specific recombinase XerD